MRMSGPARLVYIKNGRGTVRPRIGKTVNYMTILMPITMIVTFHDENSCWNNKMMMIMIMDERVMTDLFRMSFD